MFVKLKNFFSEKIACIGTIRILYLPEEHQIYIDHTFASHVSRNVYFTILFI